MNRATAAALGRETMTICEEGAYTAPSGHTVRIQPQLTEAISNTVAYPPETTLPAPIRGNYDTIVTVGNMTTLAAAHRLYQEGHKPAALNFASAKNPGGGFLNGARAQEESLARSSGLYPCLADHEMYQFHRQQRNLLYSDYMIYSPAVPVFRDDEGVLLEEPYPCAFITSPAVNKGALRKNSPRLLSKVLPTMEERTEKVLRVAAYHQHDALVLGAWGCGVFANDPAEIASLFAEALNGPYQGVFKVVVFAVLDFSAEGRFIRPFERIFAKK